MFSVEDGVEFVEVGSVNVLKGVVSGWVVYVCDECVVVIVVVVSVDVRFVKCVCD